MLKNKSFANFNSVVLDRDLLATYDRKDEKGIYKANNYLRSGGGDHNLRINKPNFWYPIYVSPDLSDITLNKKKGSMKFYRSLKVGKKELGRQLKKPLKRT